MNLFLFTLLPVFPVLCMLLEFTGKVATLQGLLGYLGFVYLLRFLRKEEGSAFKTEIKVTQLLEV